MQPPTSVLELSISISVCIILVFCTGALLTLFLLE